MNAQELAVEYRAMQRDLTDITYRWLKHFRREGQNRNGVHQRQKERPEITRCGRYPGERRTTNDKPCLLCAEEAELCERQRAYFALEEAFIAERTAGLSGDNLVIARGQAVMDIFDARDASQAAPAGAGEAT